MKRPGEHQVTPEGQGAEQLKKPGNGLEALPSMAEILHRKDQLVDAAESKAQALIERGQQGLEQLQYSSGLAKGKLKEIAYETGIEEKLAANKQRIAEAVMEVKHGMKAAAYKLEATAYAAKESETAQKVEALMEQAGEKRAYLAQSALDKTIEALSPLVSRSDLEAAGSMASALVDQGKDKATYNAHKGLNWMKHLGEDAVAAGHIKGAHLLETTHKYLSHGSEELSYQGQKAGATLLDRSAKGAYELKEKAYLARDTVKGARISLKNRLRDLYDKATT